MVPVIPLGEIAPDLAAKFEAARRRIQAWEPAHCPKVKR